MNPAFPATVEEVYQRRLLLRQLAEARKAAHLTRAVVAARMGTSEAASSPRGSDWRSQGVQHRAIRRGSWEAHPVGGRRREVTRQPRVGMPEGIRSPRMWA